MEPQHIFISYRSRELEFSLKLTSFLTQAGIPIWMDKLRGITIGDDWALALQDGVDHAVAMIVILSPLYVGSKFCMAELSRGSSRGYPIFPLMIDSVQPKDMPLEIQRVQFLNFSDWRDPHEFERQAKELIRVIREKLPNLPRVVTSPSIPSGPTVADTRERSDEYEVLLTNIPKTVSMPLSHQVKISELKKDLDEYIARWLVVTNAIRLEMSPVHRHILAQQKASIEQDIVKVEDELSRLQ